MLPAFITIAAGSFLMGTPESELSSLAKSYGGTRESYREESPQHQVALPSFAIAITPVTNALYAMFVAAGGASPPRRWRGPQPPAALADHPVVEVAWHEAQAFCAWLSETAILPAAQRGHFRLPTEAEWEYAARGSDGRRFPWGSQWEQTWANTREAGLGTTLPVGSQPANGSPHGCLDMAGNIWEWTASLDWPYPYQNDDGRNHPTHPGRRILRGGCYANPHGYARTACRFRLPPTMNNEFLGFRLVREGAD